MDIQVVNKKIKDIKTDFELILVVNKNLKHIWIKDRELLRKNNFQAISGETVLLLEKQRFYVALDSLSYVDIREACALATRTLINKNIRSLKSGLYFAENKEIYNTVKAMAEGFLLGIYKFNKYKSEKNKIILNKIIISKENYKVKNFDKTIAKTALKRARVIATSINFSRDIVNQTPQDITPLTMSKIAKDMAKNYNLTVKIYNQKYLQAKKMGAFLAVSQASPHPPQLIHLVHKHPQAKLKIALVGKGLTYDTGGLSLKLGNSMMTMKMDKAGACAVFGIMRAVSELNLPIEVHGIIGAVENAIGQHAYKPDDVLRAKNGKTIEIKNTDAEGRLVLADCLCYAQDFQPDYIIDLATLTGACVVALGEYTIGCMGHNDDLKNDFKISAGNSGELIADLPFNKYLAELLKSEIADISNISSSKWGGAITAGLFLSKFIQKKNKNKWLHLDIAGPAFNTKAWGVNSIGASGAGVALLVDWLLGKVASHNSK